MSYDSRRDTELHIAQVQLNLSQCIGDLQRRAAEHDRSKLEEPEKRVFDEWTPKLRSMTYGSEEYAEALRQMSVGLRHHYAVNDHHPEHHPCGIASMDLLQLIEMLADWYAATKRHDDGDLGRSIEQNAERFGYGEGMTCLLKRTARRLGWLEES